MSNSRLRKLPAEDTYQITGSLSRVTGPGRRTVRTLEVSRLPPGASLEPLRAFHELEQLELHRIDGVALDVVGELPIIRLQLNDARHTDLAFLARLQDLKALRLHGISECEVPPCLVLTESLEALSIIVDGPRMTADTAREVLEAIEWPRLKRLRNLLLRVGGNYAVAPIELDLGFLANLPSLRRLDVFGVWHRGPGSSPLEPPFPGLPKQFERFRIDAWDPERLTRELESYFGAPREQLGYPTVYQRYPHQPSSDWEITYEDDEPGGAWGTYGILADADLDPSIETEGEALEVARHRIRARDPELLARLEFDPESGGTGITASTRKDLENALQILGIR